MKRIIFLTLIMLCGEGLAGTRSRWDYKRDLTAAAPLNNVKYPSATAGIVHEENFDDKTDWSTSLGTLADSALHSAFGGASMKVTGGLHAENNTIQFYRGFAGENWTNCTIRFRYYVETRGDVPIGYNELRLLIASDTPTTNNNYFNIARLPLAVGQHDFTFTTSEFQTVASADITDINGLWIRVDENITVAETPPIIYFDRLEVYKNANYGKARIVIGLDDGAVSGSFAGSQYSALQYAVSKGIRTYCAIPTELIGTNANYMTWAQVEELYRTGLVNFHAHRTVPPYNSGASALAVYAQKAKQDLLDHGISNSDAEVLVLPSGTDGIAVTNVPDVNSFYVLKKYFSIIRGTGSAQTAAGAADEMGDLRTQAYISPHRPLRWWTHGRQMGNTGTVADHDNIATWITNAKNHNSILSIYAHIPVTGDITEADWQQVIDQIVVDVNAGNAEVVGLADY